jgi:hypothetical protein
VVQESPPMPSKAPDAERCRRERAESVLAAVFLVNSTGTALFLSVSTLYFVHVVGFSAARLGLGLSLAALLGLAAAIPAGAVIDRLGAGRMLILAHLWRAVAFSAYLLVHSFAAFVVTAALIAAADRAAPPASQALLAEVVPAARRVNVLARLRVWENVGFTVGLAGSALAVWLGSTSAYRVLILGNAASFLIVAILVATLSGSAVPERSSRRGFAALRTLARSDRPYLYLTALNGVLALNASVLAIGVPLWILTWTPLPRWCVPGVMLLNTVLVVLCQVRVSRGVDTLRRHGRLLLRSGAALGLALVLLGLSQRASAAVCAALLAASVCVLTLGEMWHSVGGWGVSLELAPEQARGRYLAVFGLGIGAQEVAGPAVAALLVAQGRLGLIVGAAVLFAAGAAADGVVRGVSGRVPAASLEAAAESG